MGSDLPVARASKLDQDSFFVVVVKKTLLYRLVHRRRNSVEIQKSITRHVKATKMSIKYHRRCLTKANETLTCTNYKHNF